MLKHYKHAPAHLMLDDTPYFLTGAIHGRRHLLVGDEIKSQFLDLIHSAFRRMNWVLHEWVILDNHYHLLGQSRRGEDLPRLFMDLHGRSAKLIRKVTGCAPPVWWNYWDYCPRDDEDYRVRQNYLYYNPVRHGYVQDLNHYPHSSFPRMIEQQGREMLVKQFRRHPGFRELKIEEDDF